MLATAKQEKYGIPVSGRVDVSIAKKLKEEANILDLSMSRMVHIALSEWATSEDIREQRDNLNLENQTLQTALNEAYAKIKEWEEFHKVEVLRINEKWNISIADFIGGLSEKGTKRQLFMNSFKQIFENV